VTILVTGGNGFVMSHFVRQWLESSPAERVIVLDADQPDPLAERFFAPVKDRIVRIAADILDPGSWTANVAMEEITAVVHGAAVTPFPFVASDGTRRDPEREGPRRVLEVNLTGTVALLEWARSLPHLQRFIYISTGAVYANAAGSPISENNPIDPTSLYAISKYAAERVVNRYAQLFGLPCVSIRPAAVFGPMDRETRSRHVRCVPWLIAHLAITGKELRVSAYDAVGDWINALDVADAIKRLLQAASLRHSVYNVAYGSPQSVETLLQFASEKLAIRHRQVALGEANVVCDPDRLLGRWGGYDASRMRADLGWSPAPLRQRMHEYIDWLIGEGAQAQLSLAEGE
jgi:UDP-glucose 4-epimerase